MRVADPVKSAANWALWLSLPGLCCFPIGLGGAFFGVRTIRRARRDARSVPARAVVALVLSALSLAWWGWFLVWTEAEGRARRLQRQAVTERLVGKREAAQLDAKVACDLVEEQLRKGLYDDFQADEVTCGGPLEPGVDRARLRGVVLRFGEHRIPLNACLARSERWFLLAVTALDNCPAVPPRRPDASADQAEDEMRRRAKEEVDGEQVAAFTAAMNGVARGVRSTTRERRYCPQVGVDSLKTDSRVPALTLPTIDLDRVRRPEEADDEWLFLTSLDIRMAIDTSRTIGDRAKGVRRMAEDGGPYVLVYVTEDYAWPTDWDDRATAGRWSGWMVVAGLADGKPVCEARLEFGSRPVTKGRKAEKRVKRAEDELVSDFRDKASDVMATMSGGQFRLGYRLGK